MDERIKKIDTPKKCEIFALQIKNGKRTSVSRTWQMIDRHGSVEAVKRAVCRPVETQGYWQSRIWSEP